MAALARLEGKVVIVTGGSQGIGAATVNAFLSYGARVACLDLVLSKSSAGEEFFSVACNVSNEEQCNNAIDEVVSKWGRIDVLVNNAGITDDNKGAADTTLTIWRRVLSINLDGPFYLIHGALPHMLKNEGPDRGSIVNVCSVAARSGAVAGAAYTSAKHGLLGLTRNTAWLYKDDGIRCNAVLPGGIRTNIVSNSGNLFDAASFGRLAPFMACNPGLGEPQDIADATVYLALAGNVNGAELTVDAGWLAT